MITNGQKYIITTNDWFIAPDGDSYKSAWGTCEVKCIKEVFGFDPIRPSTNWYLQVGKEGTEAIIAGCQIHYAIRCENPPEDKYIGQSYIEKETGKYLNSSRIYYAEPRNLKDTPKET
jgi:hypothetical protein